MKYRPGKQNVVADALSRPPQLNALTTVSTTLLEDIDLGDAYNNDKRLQQTWEILQRLESSDEKEKAQVRNYELHDDKVYLKKDQRLVIPYHRELRTRIICEFHDIPISGHLGIDKTYGNVSKHFYWPKMFKDIRRYVLSCDDCQRNKPSNQTPIGLLQPLEVPMHKWEQVTMDFIVQLPPTTNGHDAIIVFVDRLTKRAHFYPTHTSISAPEVAKAFFETIFKNHGLPRAIISDRDVRFTSQFWKALFQHLGTKLAMSTAFHLQTDGQTERMNRTLEDMLRIYTSYKQDNWDDYLPAAEFAYNNSKQASTGFSPFELDCGFTPLTPISMAMETPSNVKAANDFIEHWDTMIKTAKDNLQDAQERQTKYANQHRRHSEFELGDKVLLSTRNITTVVDKRRPTQKLTLKYIGPFKVIQVVSTMSYKLELPETMKIHPVFHVSLLKPYKTSDDFT